MKLLAMSFAAISLVAFFSFTKRESAVSSIKYPVSSIQHPVERKIQVAILLDVSSSMDGLIEQAKAQLWSLVNTLGKAECNDKTQPKVELALYEYGRTNNDAAKGYVKQLSPFTNDLDEVSKILFSLKTNGGSEYCGEVIYTSMDELSWDPSPDNYKVIFIAGNEDFLQGKIQYTQACTKANDKGVIVNTIYCGPYQQGILEHWNLAGECGNGSYTNINQDAKEINIPTPYDSTLLVLNSKLNSTYIGYGANGGTYYARQGAVDLLNTSSSMNMSAKRISAKAQKNVYDNSSWDLVDASRGDSAYFARLDRKTLPDSLKNKSTEQLKQLVKAKETERTAIQGEILTINASRDKYIAEEKAKAKLNSNEPTLESAVEKTVSEQVKRFNMQIMKD